MISGSVTWTEGKFGAGLQKRHGWMRLQRRPERADRCGEKEEKQQRLKLTAHISIHSHQNRSTIRLAVGCLLKKINSYSCHHLDKNIFLLIIACIIIKLSCRLGVYLNRVGWTSFQRPKRSEKERVQAEAGKARGASYSAEYAADVTAKLLRSFWWASKKNFRIKPNYQYTKYFT